MLILELGYDFELDSEIKVFISELGFYIFFLANLYSFGYKEVHSFKILRRLVLSQLVNACLTEFTQTLLHIRLGNC